MELETLRRTRNIEEDSTEMKKKSKGKPYNSSRKCKGKPCKYNEPSRRNRGSGVKEEDLNLITKEF